MKDNKRARKDFTSAKEKTAANVPAPLVYTISDEKKAKALNPPVDNSVVEEKHGYKISDPFRPLEHLDSAETNAWVDAQNLNFATYISAQKETIAQTTAFLEDAMNYARESLPSRHGAKYFSTLQDGLAPQPVYQVRDSADGPARTLFDPNTLSADGTASLSGTFPSPDGKLVAYLISQAGSDMQVMRIRDVDTGQDLPDVIEGARFAEVLWDKDSNAGFQYTYPVTPGAWGRKAMHHTLGEPAENDKLVFEKKGDAPWAEPFRMREGIHDWISTGLGFDRNNGIHYRPRGSDGPFTTLQESGQYQLHPVAEFENGDILALTSKDASRGRLVRFNLADPAPEKWQDVIPEHKQDRLNDVFWHQGKLFGFYNHDTADQISVFDVTGQHLHDVPLPPQSVAGFARVNPEDTAFLLKISSFTTPGDTYNYDIAANTLTRVKKSDAKYDLDGCIVERMSAVSKDGTVIPMTVIRQPGTQLDGTAALKLYGYGASNSSLGPGFSTTVMDWVRKGGIYVQANIRGGGEYGADWYDNGRQLNKKNVFDDFIALAEKLIEKKYTSPERLVIEGGSAGGLLTATVMTMRPELFGAVISAVPVTDVIRLHKTRGGQAIPEYGDPEIKQDFEAIRAYSPYHNVKPGTKYPPHVFKTGDHDNRVPPLHAYKMAALLQAQSSPDTVSLLRVNRKAGHGGGKPTKMVIQEYAETSAFVESAIGPINQQSYKATLAAEQAREQGRKKPPAPGA
ncbi:MAG TPA: prolyl oligopeptidase family serine peptidase [Patescibacteria group bacterium]|nr:prolyl oligopeptidase family serine peptidase [Patescibacteria group bacterium]